MTMQLLHTFMKSAYAMVLLGTMLCCMSCGRDEHRSAQASDGEQKTDSLLSEALNQGNPNRLISLIDSLEEQNQISESKANHFRATAYIALKQLRMAEFYLKKVTSEPARSQKEMSDYLNSAAELSNILVNKGDYEGALNAALPAVEQMEKTDNHGLYYAIMLESIGRCQLSLGHDGEAAASYNRAFSCYEQDTIGNGPADRLHHLIINAYNTALSYLATEHYAEARHWTERTDSVLKHYEQAPGASTAFAQKVSALVNLQRATSLQGLGRDDEASEAFKAYDATEYGSTPDGHIDATKYLVLAKRFTEAATYFQQLDQVLASWGYDLSLNNVQRFLFPKFQANVGAGRKDSAIAVGFQILNALDTAIVLSKTNDAAELAVIYDTQGKEMQIARDQESLLHARIIALIVILVLFILFFTIYFLLRRKATRRLAAAHRQLEEKNVQLEEKNVQLEEANARAEESSTIKTLFIKQISHEIRTPLNIVSGFSQLLTSDSMELDAETRSNINEKINQSTERITGLINKILELSDAYSRTMLERCDQVPVEQIAMQAINASGITTAQHIVFEAALPPEANELILTTNLAAASRALSLLLDNAMKFTKAPEAFSTDVTKLKKENVWLRVEVDRQASEVRFIVEDSGKGIPPEEAEHVFEEFVQLDVYYDGTGIGLTVARSLIRRLGGDIVLDTSFSAPVAAAGSTAADSHRGARFIMSLKTDTP